MDQLVIPRGVKCFVMEQQELPKASHPRFAHRVLAPLKGGTCLPIIWSCSPSHVEAERSATCDAAFALQ
jgi:hypothetical protein